MLPLRDNIPSRTTPVVNYLMIGICAVVFALQLADHADGQGELVEAYGMIPIRISHPGTAVMLPEELGLMQTPSGPRQAVRMRQAAEPPFPAMFTLLTCIFLHGGIAHFLGNMWFLYIFGDNVEDRLGHVGYLLFYLFCGFAASLVHWLSDTSSALPTIGASGAIAGVMGAYLLLYPRATVLTLVPLLVFWELIAIPAPIYLGIWFLIQLYSGAASSDATGVAWWAHIGGFLAGVGIALALNQSRLTQPRVEIRRPGSEPFTRQRFRGRL